MKSADRIPVIAAIGECIDRPATLDMAQDPVGLMANAVRAADAEAGGKLLGRVDAVHVVNQISWAYADPAGTLCDRLKLRPAHHEYGAVGGETPVQFLQEAAERIRGGGSSVAVICGGEAHRSVADARQDHAVLNWPARAEHAARPIRSQDIAHPLAKRLGVDIPVTVYPLFENAQNHHWGLSPAEGLADTGRIWSDFSRIAADNASAAIRMPVDPQDICNPNPANRMLAWPYTKRMVANINVNQGAAVILTSLSTARENGLDDGRLIFFEYGNHAREADDYLARPSFAVNAARDGVLEDVRAHFASPFTAVELYSCFPCVPKAARRTLGLAQNVRLSQAGGLTFFGAPLNNYMTHAVCAMVRRLRENGGQGLLYGQGGVATKHRCLILSADAPGETRPLAQSVQDKANAARGDVPPLVGDAEGAAALESYTVIHDRDDRRSGVAILRTSGGARSLAAVADDAGLLDHLESLDVSSIGMRGRLTLSSEGPARWSA